MPTVIDEFTRRFWLSPWARKLMCDDVLHCLADLFVAQGTPEQILNGDGESFNSKLRDELLAGKQFSRLCEAQVLIERWRRQPYAALQSAQILANSDRSVA